MLKREATDRRQPRRIYTWNPGAVRATTRSSRRDGQASPTSTRSAATAGSTATSWTSSAATTATATPRPWQLGAIVNSTAAIIGAAGAVEAVHRAHAASRPRTRRETRSPGWARPTACCTPSTSRTAPSWWRSSRPTGSPTRSRCTTTTRPTRPTTRWASRSSPATTSTASPARRASPTSGTAANYRTVMFITEGPGWQRGARDRRHAPDPAADVRRRLDVRRRSELRVRHAVRGQHPRAGAAGACRCGA